MDGKKKRRRKIDEIKNGINSRQIKEDALKLKNEEHPLVICDKVV